MTKVEEDGRPSVAWLTNLAPPYRRPVWSHLARDFALDVLLLERPELGGGIPVERAEWAASNPSGYLERHVATARLVRGESHYYVLRRPSVLGGKDAVVIGLWQSPAAWQVLAEARCRRMPALGFYGSHFMSWRFNRGPAAMVRQRFFQSLDAVIVYGEASRDSLASLGVPEDRIFTGFNAVDVDQFARRVSSPTQQSGALLYVGQFIERKNVDGLLRAVAQLSDHVRLTLAGSGPEQSTLERLVKELRLEDRVTFVGHVSYSSLPFLMQQHSHLVLPSHEEVWGLVVNEALATGAHTVISHECGVAASVAQMRGVFLCGTDPMSVATALDRSLRAWTGPITQPDILSRTPASFAETIGAAIRFAMK